MDSRYSTEQYNPAQQLRWWNFDETSIPRKTFIPRPNGRAMGVFRELFGEKWPRDIGSALYSNSKIRKPMFQTHLNTEIRNSTFLSLNILAVEGHRYVLTKTHLRAHWKPNTPDGKVHGAHLGPVGPRWAPCWPHQPCYQGLLTHCGLMTPYGDIDLGQH